MIHRSIKDRKDVFQPNVAIFEVERLYLMMACIQTDFNRELIAAFLKQWTIDQYFHLLIKQLIGNCLSRGKNCLINKSNINVSGLTSQIFSFHENYLFVPHVWYHSFLISHQAKNLFNRHQVIWITGFIRQKWCLLLAFNKLFKKKYYSSETETKLNLMLFV